MNKPAQQNILISTCLLGSPVRYNGTDFKTMARRRANKYLPRSTPRAPAEIAGGDGASVLSNKTKVIDNTDKNVTEAFIEGTNKAFQLAKNNNCTVATLTERSPSCGSSMIYDGSFSGVRKNGMGVTTALLERNSIRVLNQTPLEEPQVYLTQIE